MDTNIQRVSQDKIINMNGQRLLEFCKMHILWICNGRLGLNNGIGKYTYVGSSGKSVVDYILVNPSLFDNFSMFEVCEPNILSDHCAIHFCLKLKEKMQNGNIRNTGCNSNVNKKYEWKGEKAGQYEHYLFLEDEKFAELNVELQQATSSEQIDDNIKHFESLMGNICDPFFLKKYFLK